MIVLSFDGGVNNLSYCLLNYENNMYNILDWNIIDISKLDYEKCNFDNCENYAVYTNDKNECICKKHIGDLNNKFTKNNDNTKICNKCDKKSKYIYNDNNYCLLHAKEYYINNILTQIKKPNKKDFNDTIYILMIELNKRQELLKANKVVIENQPSMKNPKMKTIAMCLYNYYTIKGIIDKNITKSNIDQVKFCSPSNRFKIFNKEDIQLLSSLKNTNKHYTTTKQLSIKYCTELIKNDIKWKELLESKHKKDDYADSFLQGYCFIKYLKL